MALFFLCYSILSSRATQSCVLGAPCNFGRTFNAGYRLIGLFRFIGQTGFIRQNEFKARAVCSDVAVDSLRAFCTEHRS